MYVYMYMKKKNTDEKMICMKFFLSKTIISPFFAQFEYFKKFLCFKYFIFFLVFYFLIYISVQFFWVKNTINFKNLITEKTKTKAFFFAEKVSGFYISLVFYFLFCFFVSVFCYLLSFVTK